MIEKIEIKNFRQFEHLEVKDLKRVNFFIGKNNCGKTSILEAILHLTPEFQESVLESSRHGIFPILSPSVKYFFHNIDMKDYVHLSSQNDKNEKIEYKLSEYKGKLDEYLSEGAINSLKNRKFDIILNLKYSIKNIDSKQKTKKDSTDIDDIRGIEPANGKTQYNLRPTTAPFYIHDRKDNIAILIEQIDKIKNVLKEDILIEYLQFFDKNIKDISLSPNEGIKLRIDGVNTLMPLMVMGDGIKKYLTIVAPLIIPDNVPCLLIDEIENGLHFETIKHLLRSILKLSKEKNLQMFITTHSYEILKYLSEIMQEDEFIKEKDDVGIVKISTENNQYRALNRSMDDLDDFICTETEIR